MTDKKVTKVISLFVFRGSLSYQTKPKLILGIFFPLSAPNVSSNLSHPAFDFKSYFTRCILLLLFYYYGMHHTLDRI